MQKFTLKNGHWQSESFRERITTKQWKDILLREDDRIIFHGELRQLKAKHLGAGVLEIFKEPLERKQK